jgi:hypothetical protein
MPGRLDLGSIFDEIALSTARRVIARAPVRVFCFPAEIFIFAANGEELIRVEPRFRKQGGLEIGYTLRDPQAAADWLRLLQEPARKPERGGRPTIEKRRPRRTRAAL